MDAPTGTGGILYIKNDNSGGSNLPKLFYRGKNIGPVDLTLAGQTQWGVNGNKLYYSQGSVGLATTDPGDRFEVQQGSVYIRNGGVSSVTRVQNPNTPNGGVAPSWYQGNDSNFRTSYSNNNFYNIPGTDNLTLNNYFIIYTKWKATSGIWNPILFAGDTYKFGLYSKMSSTANDTTNSYLLPFIDVAGADNISFDSLASQIRGSGVNDYNSLLPTQQLNVQYEGVIAFDMTTQNQVTFHMWIRQADAASQTYYNYTLTNTKSPDYIPSGTNIPFSLGLGIDLKIGRQSGDVQFFNGTIERFAYFNLSSLVNGSGSSIFDLTSNSSAAAQLTNIGNNTATSYGATPEITETSPYGLKLGKWSADNNNLERNNEMVYGDSDGNGGLYLKSGGKSFKFPTTTGNVGEILKVQSVSGNTSILSWQADSTSDIRVKENISDINIGLNEIIQMRPVSFKWKEYENKKNDKVNYGLIADEVESIIPNIVGKDSSQLKCLDYNQIIAILVKGIKELKEKNDNLENEKNNMKTQITDIINRLDSAGI